MAVVRLSQDIKDAVEAVFDGWYANVARIDWDDFLYRVETRLDVDFGNDMLSPTIKAIKSHVSWYRKQV